jgi:hypothetical protein
MATTLQLRRGTAAEAAAFTGAVGELFIDTQNKLVYLHDGVTAGGVLVGGSGGSSGSAVVSGSVSGNTLTLTNSDSSTVNVNVASLATDIHVTSATVSGSVITLHNNDGSTVNIQLPSSVTGFLPGEVQEDMLPQFDAVYDLGSPTERWYDVNVANSVKIGSATLQEVDGVLTVNSEIVANNLTGTDLVANEALIGTVLHTGSTITPEGTPLEYGDTKGTLTVDGNLVAADDLHVRNKISLKQTPVVLGNVTGFETTPASSNSISIDNTLASTKSIRSIYFTSSGNTHTIYFGGVNEAAAFYATMAIGQQMTFTLAANGQTFPMTVQITYKNYNGSDYIEFQYIFMSGTEFNMFANWTQWYFPWYSGSAYQLLGISYTATTPATYTVAFDGAVPSLSTISKLYLNGVSSVSGTQSYSSIANFGAAQVGPNEPMYLNNFGFQTDAGNEYLIVSTMSGQSSAYYTFFLTCPSITLTEVNTGYAWTIQPHQQVNTPWGMGITYTVVSASNQSYPLPRSYSQYYTGNQLSISYVAAVDVKGILTGANTSISGVNKYVSNSDIRQYFNVGDVVTYKTPTTSLVFGDEASALSKAITYNENTGVISYDGLVTAVNINTSNHSLYSADIATGQTTNSESVALGYQAFATGSDSTALGAAAHAAGYYSVAIGAGATAPSQYSISIGYNNAAGSRAVYVGGGDNIGNMYHNTVIGMEGTSSSGWMWGNAAHVATLGTQYSYIQAAGDYATIINGGASAYHMSASNLIGGSTSFAPQQRHAEIQLSAYQYVYVSNTSTVYPQFGYYANSGVPLNMSTSPSSDNGSTLRLDQNNGQIAQGKVILTVQQRNTDIWGIYEIVFIARRNNAGTTSIISQTTTTLGDNSAATYWNAPTLYLNGSNLQFQITPTASMSGTYMTVHVGGQVRVSAPY